MLWAPPAHSGAGFGHMMTPCAHRQVTCSVCVSTACWWPRSSSLLGVFSICGEWGLLSGFGVWASHCDSPVAGLGP